MANLKELRLRIKSVKNTQQVTKAMKMVSAAKLRKAQDRMIKLRPYASKLKEIITHVTEAVNVSDIPSPLVEVRPIEKVLILLVTSNRGLAGPFNANIIKHAQQFVDDNYAAQLAAGNVYFMCVGSKGYDHFKRRGFNVLGKKEDYDIFSNLSFDRTNEVVERVFEGFISGEFDKVHLLYNEFKNVMAQNRIDENFLPVMVEEADHEEGGNGMKADYIFEPDREEILSELIPKSLRIQVFRAALESNAAEQGARMVAMDAATENAETLIKDLKLKYNRARQAAITTEIIEIAAGADALGS